MSDDLKAIARRTYEEIFPTCDAAGLAEVTDPNFVSHPARPGDPGGIEGAIKTMFWLASIFSNQRWEIHQLLQDGETVVVQATHHARHTGDLMGIAPTGREVAYDYVHIVRYRDGKAVEHWGLRDDLTLMRQLGVIPDRPAPVPVAS